MTTRLCTIIVAVFIPITLVACAIFPTPTPTSTPTPMPEPVPPPELVGKWKLVYVVINGKSGSSFAEGLWMDISRPTGTSGPVGSNVKWPNGCNVIAGKFEFSKNGVFRLASDEFLRTLKECIDPETGKQKAFPNHREFKQALMSVVAYELREDRLWLYYPKSKSNALVFQ